MCIFRHTEFQPSPVKDAPRLIQAGSAPDPDRPEAYLISRFIAQIPPCRLEERQGSARKTQRNIYLGTLSAEILRV